MHKRGRREGRELVEEGEMRERSDGVEKRERLEGWGDKRQVRKEVEMDGKKRMKRGDEREEEKI